MAFAAAAVFTVILFVTILFIWGGGAGRRISNDWITGLTPPQKGHDGLSFISVGGDGPRIGIKSPLMGIAMGAQAADTAKTAAYYTKAIRADKNNAALYVNRGVAYTLGGYIDSAIKDFNKAIKLDPNNSSAYFNRAIAYMGNGETGIEPAIADLMTVVAINSDDSQLYYETYYTLGSLYIRQYEFDDTKAQALLERALDAFSHIQGYRDADIIFDYISRLL
jgi:TPR repeat protein